MVEALGSSFSSSPKREINASRGSSRLGDGPSLQPRRQIRRHVLHGMNGQIDFFREQRVLDLLNKNSFRAHERRGGRGLLVSGRRDGNDLDLKSRMSGLERRRDPTGLSEGQRRSACSDPEGHDASRLSDRRSPWRNVAERLSNAAASHS